MVNEPYRIELDSVQIGAPDLEEAARTYSLLLGTTPTPQPDGGQRFQLPIGAVELVAAQSGVRSMRFTRPATADLPERQSYNGLTVLFSAHAGDARSTPSNVGVEAIDHIVINSPNVERAIALWRDQLGLRLALDREFPERGLRLVFFRSAGITLEIAGSLAAAPIDAADRYYGVTYRVRDLASWRDHLVEAGLDVSPTRPGHKRGTTVATVRSGTAGTPTLLLQDPSRAPYPTC